MILMTNDLAKVESTNSTYIARYGTGEDPYAQFANEGGPGIQGKLATCSKGDWSIGADKTPVKAGTQFLFIVPETMRGWLKWDSSSVADADMGFVRDDFSVSTAPRLVTPMSRSGRRTLTARRGIRGRAHTVLSRRDVATAR